MKLKPLSKESIAERRMMNPDELYDALNDSIHHNPKVRWHIYEDESPPRDGFYRVQFRNNQARTISYNDWNGWFAWEDGQYVDHDADVYQWCSWDDEPARVIKLQ